MESFITNLYFGAFLLPAAALAFALIFRNQQIGNTLTQSVTMLGGLSGICATILYFVTGISAAPDLSEFGFAIAPLTAFFLGIIYMGVFLTSLYAIESLDHYRETYSITLLNVASIIFILGMQATVMAGSVLMFLLAWEVMSLAAYFLVIADRSPDSMRAGFIYLIMTHIGFAAIMVGFFLLAAGNPWALWSDLAANAVTLSPSVLATSFFLLFAGFGSKAGLVPLHQWLPYAHPQAPSHSSALLSGVMLKVALFGFIQSILLFPTIPLIWSLVVIAVGLMSALFGVVHAAVESDVKRALAWSSIENMGLIVSAIGVVLALFALPATPVTMALIAAVRLFIVLHIINHFLFKSGLFMAAGAVATMTHTRDMDTLGGLAQKWPLFSGVFLALAFAAAALPPFGTFFGEWMYLQSLAIAIAALPWWGAAVATLILSLIGLVGGLAIFAFVNMFSSIFLGRARTHYAEHAKGMPFLLTLPSLIASVLLVLVGIFALSGWIPERGVAVAPGVFIIPGAAIHPWFMTLILVLIGTLLFAMWNLLRRPVIRVTDTWDCGQPLTPRMQYTSTGFSAPIRFFFRTFVLSKKHMIVTPVVASNPWIAARKLEWSVSSFWEHYVYLPLANAIMLSATLVKKLQSGVLQAYVLFLVIALVLTLAIAL